MGFFDDDSFFGGGIEELFNRLAGEGFVEYSSVGPDGKKKIIRKGKRDVFGKVFLDKIITSNKIYFIFDLSDKKEVSSKIKDELVENKYGKRVSTENKILEISDKDGFLFDFPLGELKIKSFESNFNNGILEVSFKK